MTKKELDILNNEYIKKRINDSSDYSWLLPILSSGQYLFEETLKKIASVNDIEVLKNLKKNYYLEGLFDEKK